MVDPGEYNPETVLFNKGFKGSFLISFQLFLSIPYKNILGSKEEFNEEINIKVRSTGRLLKAKVNLLENFADVEILDHETGISPGQACVFYSRDEIGDKVLGGGWIHKTFNKIYPLS